MTVGSLFAGIGGIDLGFSQAGYEILWAIEKDTACCKTYSYNYPNIELIHGDIRSIEPKELKSVDVITAGFPCQSFSVAGKQRGFDDPRGNLFYEVIRFTSALMPRVVFLENVPNLMEHDNGKTFLVIHDEFAKLGYSLRYRVMRASKYGNLPQIRDRIYIAAFKNQTDCDRFIYPDELELTVKSEEIVNRSILQHPIYYFSEDDVFYSKAKQVVKDRKSIYRIYHDSIKPIMNQMCPTLTASMGTAKNQVPIVLDDHGIRKLTIRECLAFQGFPKSFRFPNTITLNDAYKQCGNSVAVPVIRRIAESIMKVIKDGD